MYQGKLKVFTSCVNLNQEAQKYQWKKDKDGISKDDPVDKNNHLMDAMRYLVMALPYDLKEVDIHKAEQNKAQSVLDRIKLYDNNDFPNDGEGGVYGLGYYDL